MGREFLNLLIENREKRKNITANAKEISKRELERIIAPLKEDGNSPHDLTIEESVITAGILKAIFSAGNGKVTLHLKACDLQEGSFEKVKDEFKLGKLESGLMNCPDGNDCAIYILC